MHITMCFFLVYCARVVHFKFEHILIRYFIRDDEDQNDYDHSDERGR